MELGHAELPDNLHYIMLWYILGLGFRVYTTPYYITDTLV